ncbi:MAG: NAD(+) synthase, partial [Lachnospiraceae bacterium]|nr:NAD(+) synthase [Lachnospiraceae bacterium]
MYSFLRVGAAVPKIKIADCLFNREMIIEMAKEASEKKIKFLTFPELAVTGYTCGDLFMQTSLIISAKAALKYIADNTSDLDIIMVVGVPLDISNRLFNCAAVIYKGKVLGLVPKTHMPNYSDFYEKRWFDSAHDLNVDKIDLFGYEVPVGKDLLFKSILFVLFVFGIEICEDLWVPVPPSSYLAINGANIIVNPSASNEIAAKNEYRYSLISNQSARCICSYVYASSGIYESTQDTVFSGHSLICENGVVIKESNRFCRENDLIYSDIDLELIANDRRKNTSFFDCINPNGPSRFVYFDMPEDKTTEVDRIISPSPFTPGAGKKLSSRCEDIFKIQYTGLARRIIHTNAKSLVLGISGGLDSTLALLVAVKACDFLDIPRTSVLGITMPGFGTTDRTYNNAIDLMKTLGIRIKEISIRNAALQHFEDIGHDPNVHDITYENAQARERTQILMDIANKENGFVVGTGDLSELALGWATYNGDHMSMYSVNSGVPKTLVRVVVNWIAETGQLSKEISYILKDILDTPISPELLPPDKDGNINQKTEDLVGPYELHDFFIYYVVRYGYRPSKIYYLAKKAFEGSYDS